MRAGNRGSIFGLILTGILTLAAIGGLIAFCRINNISSPKDAMAYIQNKSNQVGKCYDKNGKDCDIKLAGGKSSDNNNQIDSSKNKLTDADLGYSGPKAGQPYINSADKYNKTSFNAKLSKISTLDPTKNKFNSSDWAHFIPVNNKNTCFSMKDNILNNEAVHGSIKLQDEYRNNTNNINKACSISSGSWVDSYTGDIIHNDNATLDYVIPLEYANNNGGATWSKDKKKQFSNDEENLSVVSSKSKKDRDGKTVSKWTSKTGTTQCEFSRKYINVLYKYSLSVSSKDKQALSTQLMKCNK